MSDVPDVTPTPDEVTLRRWAADTWSSLAAMTHPDTGLPADYLRDDLDPATRSGYTSPTNIGGLLWSTVGARALGLVSDSELETRCAQTLSAVAALERHEASGLLFNWYDEADGTTLRTWPASGEPIVPFLSSVDNGWLAAGLAVVASAVPALRAQAESLLGSMRFDVLHDPDAGPPGPGGRLRGGFWAADPGAACLWTVPRRGGEALPYTVHHYDLLDSEPRIASYVGIALGQIPPEHLGALDRTRRTYAGRTVVATFGGSMFEELMPLLMVPESRWAPDSWGRNHADAVACHRHWGLEDRAYGYWGFSPSACPVEGYHEFGVAPIAWRPGGYPSEWDGEAVVTPHAAALALQVDWDAAATNLTRIETELGAYGPGGFVDSVGVRTRRTAGRYLALDQSMVLGALANVLCDNVLQRAFTARGWAETLQPVVATAW